MRSFSTVLYWLETIVYLKLLITFRERHKIMKELVKRTIRYELSVKLGAFSSLYLTSIRNIEGAEAHPWGRSYTKSTSWTLTILSFCVLQLLVLLVFISFEVTADSKTVRFLLPTHLRKWHFDETDPVRRNLLFSVTGKEFSVLQDCLVQQTTDLKCW